MAIGDSDFSPHTGINWHGDVGTVQYGGGDRNLVAMFYTRPMHNPAKSNEAGRPIYEDKVYIRIHPPGERLNIVDRPATSQDQRRFPMQWNQFKDNQQQIPEGTPIDLLYPDQPSIAATLKANGVHTIEQCAQLSANAIESIGMGSQRYVNDSVKYLEAANKGVGASQLRKELEDRDRKIASLEHKVDLLIAENDRLKNTGTTNVTLEQLQTLIAGQQGRPQFPANAPKQMAQPFDAATAMINATSPTNEVAQRKRSRSRIKN